MNLKQENTKQTIREGNNMERMQESSLGCCREKACKQGTVQNELENLLKAMEAAYELTSRLENKLSPVCMTAPRDVANEDEKHEARSEIFNVVRDVTKKANKLCVRINNLIEDIEL